MREALVLTAGIGTRLRPLSYDRAKAAVPVAGVPLIHRILSWLADLGTRRVVLNLHHRADTITRLVGDGSDLGVSVRYSWENPILGSAGGPRRALSFFDTDPLLIVNGDTLTDVDVNAMAAAHAGSGAQVTMAVIPNPDPSHYGGVMVDDRGWITAFTPPGTEGPSHHFIGVQIAQHAVFADLPPGRRSETVNELYPVLMRRTPGSVRAFVSNAQCRDIGTPADYLETSLHLAKVEGGSTSALVGEGVRIDPTARLRDTIVWDRVTIEPACELWRAIIGDDVRIPAGSRFAECSVVLARGRTPSAGEELRGELLVSPLTVRPGPGGRGARAAS